jgi:hypothetical protein
MAVSRYQRFCGRSWAGRTRCKSRGYSARRNGPVAESCVHDWTLPVRYCRVLLSVYRWRRGDWTTADLYVRLRIATTGPSLGPHFSTPASRPCMADLFSPIPWLDGGSQLVAIAAGSELGPGTCGDWTQPPRPEEQVALHGTRLHAHQRPCEHRHNHCRLRLLRS